MKEWKWQMQMCWYYEGNSFDLEDTLEEIKLWELLLVYHFIFNTAFYHNLEHFIPYSTVNIYTISKFLLLLKKKNAMTNTLKYTSYCTFIFLE